MMAAFLEWFKSHFSVLQRPTLSAIRTEGYAAALVLLHGFGGDLKETWGQFPAFISEDPRTREWDLYGIGYPSSLRVDVPIWDADPALSTLARSLRTTLSLAPLASYDVLALAAHSMGGLVVQRAIVDDPQLLTRVSHVALFGTPSSGLRKANWFAWLKRQARDMGPESEFITDLRKRWSDRFDNSYPFEFRVVAGDRDDFVPIASSLEPFEDSVQAVIPGNHLEIVKPGNSSDLSVQLLIDVLAGNHPRRDVIGSARLAVERRQFRLAVDALLPRAEELDEAALVSLALALDGLGRAKDALEILENRYQGQKTSPEILGVLGGRIKRRWLTERLAEDFRRARELYLAGLTQAEGQGDHEQAYYHAINVAFLDFIASGPTSGVPPSARDMAVRAQKHSAQSADHYWKFATEGDAHLILGNLQEALGCYRKVMAEAPSPRSVDSMYGQSVQIAARMFGERGLRAIDSAFKISMP